MGASPYLSHLPLADVSSTLAKSTTPAVAGSIRRLPGVASRGSLRLPRAVFWRPFRALIPIAKSTTPAVAGVFPPRHLWRGGGRQAGGEVIPLSRVQASRSRNRAPFSCHS